MADSIDRRTILQTLAAGVAFAAGSQSAQISDQVVGKDIAKMNPQPFGDLRIYLEGSTGQLKGLTVGSLELKPGQSPHPPHTHAEEELIIVTDGRADIVLGGKTFPAATGSVQYVAGNHLHGITNTSAAPMTFYFIKWTAK